MGALERFLLLEPEVDEYLLRNQNAHAGLGHQSSMDASVTFFSPSSSSSSASTPSSSSSSSNSSPNASAAPSYVLPSFLAKKTPSLFSSSAAGGAGSVGAGTSEKHGGTSGGGKAGVRTPLIPALHTWDNGSFLADRLLLMRLGSLGRVVEKEVRYPLYTDSISPSSLLWLQLVFFCVTAVLLHSPSLPPSLTHSLPSFPPSFLFSFLPSFFSFLSLPLLLSCPPRPLPR